MSSPIKSSFKTEWFSLSLIIIAAVSGIYFYQNFPVSMATHWGLNGEVNGYSSSFMAAFLLPLMMFGIYLLFLVLPNFDPKKDQYPSFASVYLKLRDLILAFLFIVYLLAALNGLGYAVNIANVVPAIIGLLFVILGFLLKNVKMNWFLGIRTPWTMSSETVWNKTHKLGSRVFALAGFFMAATVLVSEKFKIVLFVLSIFLMVFILPAYSYYLFLQEKKSKSIK